MYKRMRKFGFTNKPHKIEYAPLNLSRLQFWIDTGRIDASQKITMKTLIDSGCVGQLRKLQQGVKLLGDVRAHSASATPIYFISAISTCPSFFLRSSQPTCPSDTFAFGLSYSGTRLVQNSYRHRS